MQLRHSRSKTNTRSGFTLVEMLVVVPVALLVIVGLIGGMIVMIGDSLTSNGRVATAYTIQDTLNRIEEDTRFSINFMDNFSYFSSPQGKNNDATAFSYNYTGGTNNGDLILTQHATTSSPYGTTRDLIFYTKQPAACGDANEKGNRTLKSRTIYFLNTSTKTLWRRTIVNPWTYDTSGSSGADSVCAKPWQRNSCAPGVSGTVCAAKDERMLTGVSAFTVTYYNKSNDITSNPAEAEIVSVRITADTLAGGKTITQTSELRAARRNDIAADAKPGTPIVSVLNPSSTEYNNPTRASFQWSAIDAMAYTYQIKKGTEDWATAVTTTNNQVSVNTASPGDAVQIRVQAVNDTGASGWVTFPTSSSTPTATEVLNARFPIVAANVDASNWQTLNTIYGPPSFTRTSAGLIVLRGMIKAADGVSLTGQTNIPIMTLPPGYRPRQTFMFTTLATGNAAAYIVVDTNGLVKYAQGSGDPTGWLSLDSIRFLAKDDDGIPGAPLSVGWTAPTYPAPTGSGYTNTAPWSNYTGRGGYGTTSFAKDSLGRSYLYGLVKAPTPNPPPQYSVIATVPSGFSMPSGQSDTYPNALIGSP